MKTWMCLLGDPGDICHLFFLLLLYVAVCCCMLLYVAVVLVSIVFVLVDMKSI